MPTLVLDEPHGSVLHERLRAPRCASRSPSRSAHGVPWGISESAYAGSDHTLAYQYAPQGVPRLALRRTPPDELVVAPVRHRAGRAGRAAPRRRQPAPARDGAGARGRYGFIEALDYTPARQIGRRAVHAGVAPSWRTTRA